MIYSHKNKIGDLYFIFFMRIINRPDKALGEIKCRGEMFLLLRNSSSKTT